MTHGTRVEVEEGDTHPTVVKTATTDVGRSALAREAERLSRAGHPGVVELLAHDGDRLVLAWAGGRTLALTRPPVTVAAAILAAVASTVADLHELGIVHGRLDASHVLLGIDGRPRLCGLCGPLPGSADPTPADDVAAIGGLIDGLVGPEAELEPIPDRRWGRRRWSGYQRRSLQTLADQASHDDPARRPTARALAAAIASAVPEARIQPADPRGAREAALPPLPPLSPLVLEPPAKGVEPTVEPLDEPLGTPGSLGRATEADHPRTPVFRLIDHPEPDVCPDQDAPLPSTGGFEASPTDGPPTDGPLTGRVSTDPGPTDEDPLPEDGSTGDDDGTPDVDRAGSDRPQGSDPTDEPGPWGSASAEPDLQASPDQEIGSASTILGLRVERVERVDDDPGLSRIAGGPATDEPIDGPTNERDDRRVRPWPSSARGVTVRPPATSSPHRTWVLAGAAALLALVALTGWLRPIAGDPTPPGEVLAAPPGDRASTANGPPGTELPGGEADTRPTPDTMTAPAPEATTVTCGATTRDVSGGPDVDGDGCPDELVVSGTSIQAAGATYSVGRAGDQVAVDDWDCDGTATPGLVRPATGEVFLFDGWAAADQALTIVPAAVVPGARRLVPIPATEPCPGPSVVLEDRTTRTIETPRGPP